MKPQSASPRPSLPSPLFVMGAIWLWEPRFLVWEASSAFFRRTAPGDGYGRCWKRGPWNAETVIYIILTSQEENKTSNHMIMILVVCW